MAISIVKVSGMRYRTKTKTFELKVRRTVMKGRASGTRSNLDFHSSEWYENNQERIMDNPASGVCSLEHSFLPPVLLLAHELTLGSLAVD